MSILDETFFYAVNHLPHTPVLDTLAEVLHLVTKDAALYGVAVLLGFLLLRGPRRILFVFGGILAWGTTYFFVDIVGKTLIARPRPFTVLVDVVQLNGVPDSWSFPSGQAAAAAVFATLCFVIFPRWWQRTLAIAFAFLVFVDRVYMGQHYPSDVVAGAIAGVAITCAVSRLLPVFLEWQRVRQRASVIGFPR